MPQRIYLDYNATSPIHPRVLEEMTRAWQSLHGNPASQHGSGRAARRRLQQAKERILGLLGADAGREGDRLILTSGGTEANNLAILGMANARTQGLPGRLIVSSLEHPSVLRAAEHLLDLGWRMDTLDVLSNGQVNLRSLERWLTPDVALVSVTAANHETGVVQPLNQVVAICHSLGVPVHSDAVQTVGKMPLSFRDLGVDALTVTPHKFAGPLGIGALILRPGAPLSPILFGGEHQEGLRPGTESVALAVGMEVALEIAVTQLDENARRMTELRQRFEGRLRAAFPDIIVHGTFAPRLPQTVNLAFPGVDNQLLFTALDMEGVECSLGSACVSGSPEPSPTLLAMKLPQEVVRSSLRFSFGPTTTIEELDAAAETVASVVRRLRS